MGIDGDLDVLWDWLVQSRPGTTWEPPSTMLPRINGEFGWFERKPTEPGWYWAAYPALAPFYPIPTASPEWVDAWSMQDFHGFWW